MTPTQSTMDHLLTFLKLFGAKATIFLLLKYIRKRRQLLQPTLTHWPVLGMLPDLLLNLHHFHEWCTGILTHSGGSFYFHGPWFSSLKLLLTVDPANVHHIMSKNFSNFPKGEKFAEICDIFGDGIFSADSELWRYQRRITHSFLTHPRFHRFLIRTVRRKADEGLLPILDNAWRDGRVIDVEDLFQRFSFDIISTLVTGMDPRCLCQGDLPDVPFAKALNDAEEVMFHRHVVPECVWKLQRWLGVGKERKMKEAWVILDKFIYECLELKKEQMSKKELKKDGDDDDDENGVDLLTLYMEENRKDRDDHSDFKFSDKFLRDMFLNLLIAGRDTTSSALTWFIWVLFKNPKVESLIQEEIKSVIRNVDDDNIDHKGKMRRNFLETDEINNLVYLHGALCETLRLYPPVPMQHKSPLETETLPSGHRVDPSMKIIFNLYAMGRMEAIWGKDCNEVKPERWVTRQGRIKHEPSYKFLAFNAGPRTCLGKDMAFTQMKAVVSSVLMRGYHLEVVNEEDVDYDLSIVLRTKHGLKVKVCKEESI